MNFFPSAPDEKSLKFLLHRIGLSLREITVYECIFRYGPQPSSVIARQVKMNRTTVYHVLQRLTNQGLLYSFRKGNVLCFDLSPFESAVAQIDQEKDYLQLKRQILRQLMELVRPCA